MDHAAAFAELGSLADAGAFGEAFFAYNNREHRHSGIGLRIRTSVHFGTASQSAISARHELDAANTAHPEHFSHRRPSPRGCPTPRGSTSCDRGPHTDRLTEPVSPTVTSSGAAEGPLAPVKPTHSGAPVSRSTSATSSVCDSGMACVAWAKTRPFEASRALNASVT